MSASPPWPQALRLCAVFLCCSLPWLTPVAGGPSSSVQPWLFSATCALVLAAFTGAGGLPMLLGAGAAALGGWTAWRSVEPDPSTLLAGLALIVVAAAAASQRRRDPRFVGVVAAAWLAAGLASTAIALAQSFGVADALAPFASASPRAEAFANLRQRNQFGSLCAIALAALLWGLPRGARGWRYLAAAVLAVGSAATTSRVGLLQLLLLGLAALVWADADRKYRSRLWLVAAVAYVAAALALPWLQQVAGVAAVPIWERVTGLPGCSSRTVLWSNVLHLIAQRPLAGWGWGELDYAHFVTLYPGERFCDILDNAHNLPLHLAVELGVPAAVLAMAAAGWWVLRSRPWAEAEDRRRLAWAVLGLVAAHSAVEYPLWYGPFQLACGLAIGILWPRREPDRGSEHGYAIALPALLGLAVGYAAWDYQRVSQIYLRPEDRIERYRDDPLAHGRQTRLFRSHAQFAELTTAPLTAGNADWTLASSLRLLHHSPEPAVIEKVVESAVMKGREDLALWYLARYRAAFPRQHADWANRPRASQAGAV
ncbi:PglL family O-oligosaccharyltransferase [Ramlibacter sp.]|uniref:PglL family O-oligosaccharyltransferase n=1 Tax=Ramlibacter sp. TaxID=1917967 RepID=UPI002D315D04|nr:Wzy polymerase domain-containing protein [Ramlibacter sp.]HYD74573.1 Wzy polymerase domain-containing protein [Ramlibacter sp.]